jgi:hypothetical protein
MRVIQKKFMCQALTKDIDDLSIRSFIIEDVAVLGVFHNYAKKGTKRPTIGIWWTNWRFISR